MVAKTIKTTTQRPSRRRADGRGIILVPVVSETVRLVGGDVTVDVSWAVPVLWIKC